MKFIESITEGDNEFAHYIQRALGYSVFGHTREQVFFLIIGLGANGKGVLLRVLNQVLGDYGSYLDLGVQGLYAHNIFSAWVDLGFVGFVWILLMLLIPFCVLAMEALRARPEEDLPELMLTLELVAVTLLLLFTAKEFTYMLTGAALGRYARYRYGKYRRMPGRRVGSAGLRLMKMNMQQEM